MNYREKMKEYLKEPNEICNHYGKWGILNKEQRDLITRLLNEMDGADNYIIKLQHENKQLKERIDKAIKYIVKETKSMPINGCKIRLTELQNILKEVK